MSEQTTFADDDWRSRSSLFQGGEFRRNLEKIADLERFAEARGATELELGQADLERVDDIMSGAVPVAGPSPEPV
jgi:hypothetical protein